MMDQMMEQHKFLDLPRVSSPALFDHLCPFSPKMRPKRSVTLDDDCGGCDDDGGGGDDGDDKWWH